MLTIAYLANEFPSAVEPYVVEEIEDLRRRGIHVVAGSVRRSRSVHATSKETSEVVLLPLSKKVLVRAAGLCVRKWVLLAPVLLRVLFRGREGPLQRLRALAHTFLGACYAVLLQERGVEHIHVHHGYFGSWVGMTAARLLGAGFSLTLHGSDLLLHGTYLDVKLASCKFCLTVSEYNRQYICARYRGVEHGRILVSRMGVEVSETLPPPRKNSDEQPLNILAVGRLHAVKDHAFLVRACARLAALGAKFECSIAGDGPEHESLRTLIRTYGLAEHVTLLGHVARDQMASLYDRADVVVLTSRSEGIPLVLMEAMARGKIVLAPAITGIPELVIAGKTGFLYEPGSLNDFLDQLLFIHSLIGAGRHAVLTQPVDCAANPLDWVRHAARVHVRHNFNRSKNLELFGDLFLKRIEPQSESIPDENLVLQQI